MSKDYYKILGVPPSATDSEIKAAFRTLAKKYHPDHYASGFEKVFATRKMQAINEAYAVLGSPERRQEYDRHYVYSSRPTASAPKTTMYSATAKDQVGWIWNIIFNGGSTIFVVVWMMHSWADIIAKPSLVEQAVSIIIILFVGYFGGRIVIFMVALFLMTIWFTISDRFSDTLSTARSSKPRSVMRNLILDIISLGLLCSPIAAVLLKIHLPEWLLFIMSFILQYGFFLIFVVLGDFAANLWCLIWTQKVVSRTTDLLVLAQEP